MLTDGQQWLFKKLHTFDIDFNYIFVQKLEFGLYTMYCPYRIHYFVQTKHCSQYVFDH